MTDKLKEKLEGQIEILNDERARILQTLCENDKLYIPEIILQIVFRARSITKTIQSLKMLLYGDES